MVQSGVKDDNDPRHCRGTVCFQSRDSPSTSRRKALVAALVNWLDGYDLFQLPCGGKDKRNGSKCSFASFGEALNFLSLERQSPQSDLHHRGAAVIQSARLCISHLASTPSPVPDVNASLYYAGLH